MTSVFKGARAALLVSVALGLMTGAAVAQTTNIEAQNRGPYIGIGGGANFQERSRFRGGGADATTGYDTGYVGLGSLGYAFGNGLRLEVEPGYRRNDFGNIGGATGTGHLTEMTLLGNVIYDLPYRVPGNMPFLRDLLPHIGVGAGVARVINRSAPYNGLSVTGNETAPAFQAIAGVEYALTPGFKVGLDYRYLLIHDVNFHVAETGIRTKAGDLNNHSILLTLRYEFGTPAYHPVRAQPAAAVVPPAPPAPPPPAAPRNFVVYFDLNRATLTPAAREVVRQAATNAERDRSTRITVTGHTDTTGNARHNLRLSEQRAAAVQAELVANGVPADQIVTSGQGESDLAVPTANGVNEPRNRRVVIVEQAPGT